MYQRVDDEITVYQRAKTERIALKDKRSIDQNSEMTFQNSFLSIEL